MSIALKFAGKERPLITEQDLRSLATSGAAEILIHDQSGSVLFRYGSTGIGFNPATGAWSAPLDFRPGEAEPGDRK